MGALGRWSVGSIFRHTGAQAESLMGTPAPSRVLRITHARWESWGSGLFRLGEAAMGERVSVSVRRDDAFAVPNLNPPGRPLQLLFEQTLVFPPSLPRLHTTRDGDAHRVGLYESPSHSLSQGKISLSCTSSALCLWPTTRTPPWPCFAQHTDSCSVSRQSWNVPERESNLAPRLSGFLRVLDCVALRSQTAQTHLSISSHPSSTMSTRFCSPTPTSTSPRHTSVKDIALARRLRYLASCLRRRERKHAKKPRQTPATRTRSTVQPNLVRPSAPPPPTSSAKPNERVRLVLAEIQGRLQTRSPTPARTLSFTPISCGPQPDQQ